ncbi:sodium:calcium antiporter [Fulvivirgaceae bacterium BMA12]|uniref:Sodium:calcium antiporter n=1 Tax=Agaribacillus aureus TaxID=3051825 RepID=A0ABT8LHB7_9BACT|nr:sodium:calcium antiporter [Fulvivirgaceae bacterium BMA12]
MFELFLLLIGLLGLWLGTEIIIKSALTIANYYQLSQVFIGLTILAVGTDLPEMVISINGSIQQLEGVYTSGVIFGNALGSCLSQLGLVLGVAGWFGYLSLTKSEIKQDGSVLIGSVVLLFLTAMDGVVSRTEGVILMLAYLIYYFSLLRREKVNAKIRKSVNGAIGYSLLLLLGGIVIVIVTSGLVVDNALALAERWQVKQSLVAIIIIGPGSSLPELALSVGAIMKKAAGLSVGNLIGSNIFDALMPVGIGAAISPLVVNQKLVYVEVSILFVLSFLVLLFFMCRKGLQKKESAALVAFYLLFIMYKLMGQ